MKNITRFEKSVPIPTSILRREISATVAPQRCSIVARPIDFSSSTSCAALPEEEIGGDGGAQDCNER